MKFILFLIFTIFVATDDQVTIQQQTKLEPVVEQKKEEKVENIELEMTPEIQPVNSKNTVKLKKSTKKQVERQLREERRMSKMRKLFLKDVDIMIKKFNLDRELDENKLDEYFKDLEDQLFNNMKENFLKNKDYTQMYDNLVEEYNNIKKQYE